MPPVFLNYLSVSYNYDFAKCASINQININSLGDVKFLRKGLNHSDIKPKHYIIAIDQV